MKSTKELIAEAKRKYPDAGQFIYVFMVVYIDGYYAGLKDKKPSWWFRLLRWLGVQR